MTEDHSEKVRRSMERARENGRYTARPIRFTFIEDVDELHPESVFTKKDRDHKTYTLVMSESRLYEYARMGYSINRIAKIIGISPSTLYYAMNKRSDANPRFRGVKDRYTEYMRLYNLSKGGCR